MPPGKRGRPALAAKSTNSQLGLHDRGKKRAATDDLEKGDDSELKPKGARGRPRVHKIAKLSDTPDEFSTVEAPERPAAQPAKRGRKPKAQVATPPMEAEIPETQQVIPVNPIEPEVEIPETQPAGKFDDLDDSLDDEQVEDLPAAYAHASILSSAQRVPQYMFPPSAMRNQPLVPMSTGRVQYQKLPFHPVGRPMTTSDPSSDPALRRQLGELTRKYENLEVRYRDLRDIGVKEAEHNYDRLKKQGEERAHTANQLIETLKAQLAAQTELAKEGQRLRQQLDAAETRASKLEDDLAGKSKSLADSKSEVKTLTTRLAAARAAEAATVKVPGSAMKGNVADKRLLANAEAAVQSAQMKEDLYADLTGLIVRGIKRDQDDEVYDCIQTGRNGTLHFKLSVTPDDQSDDLDEVQFMYMPQLDEDRDSDLLDILPDYLTEEITFPRTHAAKFYSRVMKFLTEKLE
ncbi:hypothetical protein PFICI_05190 [Pestalotiopsis fici W106-1]|uniref:Monopolin complex subunit Csm1/Pcs1 C-terminal domain-containing protein n=1 Tax=Pestalotiopsis fici (strain W106-1 / CGMCC3.15140) TaxID=1229662 RepID=W3XBB8_PESFW|nr:uncharacterized protein PFICI_05190 [Pestalotiopsis fici W106-1]ETS83314.1 hypothetical protein PFICI_05190 [Pestalotiopsis fici W106-1]